MNTLEQTAGTLDPTFGGGTGVAVSPYTSNQVGGIVVQTDGKILITATINGDLGVIRLNSDGTIDATFGGGDGLVTINISSGTSIPYSITLQTDGKILISGEDSQLATLIRLNNDGTLDNSFSGDGIVTYEETDTTSGFFDKVVIEPDGQIIVAGTLSDFFQTSGVLIRYNLDGSQDTSFNENTTSSEFIDLVTQTDEKIISSQDGGLFRFNSNGSLDFSWGEDGDGRIQVDDVINLSNSPDFDVIALQTDGKLLVTGTIRDSGIRQLVILRLDVDGTLDPSFGVNGIKIIDFDDSISGINALKGITIQADGKLLVTALLDSDNIGLARFNSDGSIDTTFGNSGSIITPVTNDEDENLVLQPDGKVLVAGINNGFISVVRYLGDPVLVFDAAQYGASYADLITGIGYNLDALTQHYQNSGRFEGRQQDLFNEYRYIASNSDLIGAFGLNGAGATYHYITSGYYEGRSLTGFIPSRYLNAYDDLFNAFGTDTLAATQHYITNGFSEGRDPNLFQSDRYIASHTDLIQVYRYNLEAGSNHYLFSGRTEGRQISFSPETYLSRYGDLQAAFGNDLNAATAHYITTGFDEGRTWI